LFGFNVWNAGQALILVGCCEAMVHYHIQEGAVSLLSTLLVEGVLCDVKVNFEHLVPLGVD